jgi:predicted transcriptional regulator
MSYLGSSYGQQPPLDPPANKIEGESAVQSYVTKIAYKCNTSMFAKYKPVIVLSAHDTLRHKNATDNTVTITDNRT